MQAIRAQGDILEVGRGSSKGHWRWLWEEKEKEKEEGEKEKDSDSGERNWIPPPWEDHSLLPLVDGLQPFNAYPV